jgi:microcystin-dependent protein
MAFSFKKFFQGLTIVPKTTSTADSKGDLEVLSGTGKLGYHDGATVSNVVTELHTATLENKTIVAVDNTITTSASGNLIATELNAALAELDIAIGDVFSDLGAHIIDTVDAHDASAISNVPSGTIAATDVQAAINELDGDAVAAQADATQALSDAGAAQADATQALADAAAAQSDIDNHILDSSDAHDASAISNVPTGNLVATDVQTALNELQSDIDTTNSTKVTGPASATDEAIARFDGTTGKLIQNSVATISDSGVAAGLTGLTSSGTVTASGTLSTTGSITESFSTDSSTTGANATVSSPTTPVVRLTNASLTSVDLLASPVAGRVITIVNATGNAININNNTGGTAANRILTGTKATLSLADEASIIVKYDSTESRWMVIGGTGAGGGASLDTILQLTGGDVPLWSTGDNAAFLGGGTLSGTFVADTTTPLQGLSSYVYTQAAGSLNDYLASPALPVDIRFRGQNVTMFFPFTYDGASNDIEVIFYDVTNAAIIPTSTFIQNASTVGIFKTNVLIPSTCASIRVGFMTRVLNSGKIFEFDSVQLTSDTTIYANIAQGNIGEVMTFAGSVTPNNFLFCNGSAVSRSTYSALFSVLGVTHGSGDGSTTFNIPDYRGQFLRGVTGASLNDPDTLTRTAMNTGGNTGNNVGSIQDDAFQGHGHTIGINGISAGGGSGALISTATQTAGRVTTPSTLSGYSAPKLSDETRPTNAYVNYYIRFATSAPNGILTVPDTFSTDTAPLVYANAATYTISTLPNAPVGTYITYTYTISTNTAVQTTGANRPTQTDADMNTNGINLYTRVFAAAGASATPTRLAIQIGKGLKGLSLGAYKSDGKVISGELDNLLTNTAGTAQAGLFNKSYNEVTGILVLDCGICLNSGVTTNNIQFQDGTAQNNAYITINASKNPALTGLNISAVAARGVNSAGTSISNAATVIVTYDATKTFDTNGALNTATGVFTAPESGYYQASWMITYSDSAYVVGNRATSTLMLNSASYAIGTSFEAEAAATSQVSSGGSTVVFLAKGHTLHIETVNNRGAGATVLLAAAHYNYFSIHKTSIG